MSQSYLAVLGQWDCEVQAHLFAGGFGFVPKRDLDKEMLKAPVVFQDASRYIKCTAVNELISTSLSLKAHVQQLSRKLSQPGEK